MTYQPKSHPSKASSKEWQDWTPALTECWISCLTCWKKSTDEGNKQAAIWSAECAKACEWAVQSKCWDSEFQHQAWDWCAQASKKCADECSKLHTSWAQECAEACKKCWEVCSHWQPVGRS